MCHQVKDNFVLARCLDYSSSDHDIFAIFINNKIMNLLVPYAPITPAISI